MPQTRQIFRTVQKNWRGLEVLLWLSRNLSASTSHPDSKSLAWTPCCGLENAQKKKFSSKLACLGPKDCNNFLFINIFFSPALGRYSSLHHTVKEYMQTVPAQSWSNIKAESWNWKHLHSPTPEPQTTPETLCGPPQGSPRGSPALSWQKGHQLFSVVYSISSLYRCTLPAL